MTQFIVDLEFNQRGSGNPKWHLYLRARGTAVRILTISPFFVSDVRDNLPEGAYCVGHDVHIEIYYEDGLSHRDEVRAAIEATLSQEGPISNGFNRSDCVSINTYDHL